MICWQDHIDSLLTFSGIVIATGMVLYQLNRQHKSGLQLQRDAFKKEMNLKIYENISEVVDSASSANSSVGMDIFNLPLKFGYTQNNKIRFDPEAFNIQHHKAAGLVTDVLLVLEKYEITLPGFRIFRLAINVQAARVMEEFKNFYSLALKYLTIDPANGDQIYLQIPTHELENLDLKTEDYWGEQSTMNSYLSDLQVDAQNWLLSDVFDGEVPGRSPADLSFMAITCDLKKEIEIIKFLWGQIPSSRRDYFQTLLKEY